MSRLILSPHADDAEIGMGGIMNKHLRGALHAVLCASTYRQAETHVMIGPDVRRKEHEAACSVLGVGQVWQPFPEENRLNLVPVDMVASKIEGWVREFGVTSLYVPLPSANQDHTAVWNAVQVVARKPHPLRIYAYEQPGQVYPIFPEPQFGWRYYPISEHDLSRKWSAMNAHASQKLASATGHSSIDAVTALATMRGFAAGALYAERLLTVREIR